MRNTLLCSKNICHLLIYISIFLFAYQTTETGMIVSYKDLDQLSVQLIFGFRHLTKKVEMSFAYGRKSGKYLNSIGIQIRYIFYYKYATCHHRRQLLYYLFSIDCTGYLLCRTNIPKQCQI